MKGICSSMVRFALPVIQPVTAWWARINCERLLWKLKLSHTEVRNLEALARTPFVWEGKPDELVAAAIEEDLEVAQDLLVQYIEDFHRWVRRTSKTAQPELQRQFSAL